MGYKNWVLTLKLLVVRQKNMNSPENGDELSINIPIELMVFVIYLDTTMKNYAIHQHPDRVDGICYLSRHDNEKLCYGIFDRVESQISEEQLCDGKFQPLRLETSSEDSCRSLIKLTNRQQSEVNLDSVLQHYGHQITTDIPVTGIDINDVVN
jgi:hypothetical protein